MYIYTYNNIVKKVTTSNILIYSVLPTEDAPLSVKQFD